MQVILHIGTEKTGSTSIQSYLSKSRKDLISHGVLPACAIDRQFGRNNFALVLASIEDPGAELLRFREQPFNEYRKAVQVLIARKFADLQLGTRVVFSSEHLSSRLITEEQVGQLKTLFPEDVDFQILCYVRPQHELFLSFQSEAVKAGRTNLEFADPLTMPEDRRYGPRFFDYAKMLALWEAIFGRHNILLVPFQSGQLVNSDVVSDFCHRTLPVELAAESQTEIPRENKSLSGAALFVLSCLNSVDDTNRIRNMNLVKVLDEGDKTGLAERDWLLRFYESFNESNRAAAKRYLDRESLFTGSLFDYQRFDFRDLESVKNVFTNYLLRTVDLVGVTPGKSN